MSCLERAVEQLRQEANIISVQEPIVETSSIHWLRCRVCCSAFRAPIHRSDARYSELVTSGCSGFCQLSRFSPRWSVANGPGKRRSNRRPKRSVFTVSGRPSRSSKVWPTGGKHSDQFSVHHRGLHSERRIVHLEDEGDAQSRVLAPKPKGKCVHDTIGFTKGAGTGTLEEHIEISPIAGRGLNVVQAVADEEVVVPLVVGWQTGLAPCHARGVRCVELRLALPIGCIAVRAIHKQVVRKHHVL